MLNGVGIIILNFDLNLTDGSGRTWGTWVNEAENYDGTWGGVYHGTFEHFALSIHSFAAGTGELSGIKPIGRYEGPTDPPDPSPCENPLEAETWRVVVIER